MTRWLQSSWLTALTGCLLYLAVTAAFLRPGPFARVGPALSAPKNSTADQPSWKFSNPEFDQWIGELRREKEALAVREQQLQELQARLNADRQELIAATQTIHQLQAEFDKNVLRIKDQEIDNLKRQAKVMAGMTPESAAGLINEMSDDEAARILYTMKAEEASALIEALSKTGKSEAKRAAGLTEKMRRMLPPAAGVRPKTQS
jgi:flagellar motility protein MotE (MotC chaperone)